MSVPPDGGGYITTASLLQKLFKTRGIKHFIRRYGWQMDPAGFGEHISALCAARGVRPARVIERAGIERTFGYQLFSGRRAPSRDKAIQLAFGLGLGYDGAQGLLKAARKSPLYPRVRRDAVIIFALENGHGLAEAQATLYELALPPLGDDRRE